MKKILAFMAFLFIISSSCFARIAISVQGGSAGLYFDLEKDACNTLYPIENTVTYTPVSALSTDVMWEFQTDNTKKLHFGVGLTSGIFLLGMYILPEFNMSYKIAEFPKLRIELSSNLIAGPSISFFGDLLGFGQISADVVFMSPKRTGIYGGIGMSNLIIPVFERYEDYGTSFTIYDNLALHLVLGLRF